MTAIIADLQISSTSKQFVRVPIYEQSGADPTSDVVSLSFPDTTHEPTVFITGSWVTIEGTNYAQAVVGPGSALVLAIGFYDVYVKVEDNPEIPVLFSGLLEVT